MLKNRVLDNPLSDSDAVTMCLLEASLVDIMHLTFQTLTIGSDKKYYEYRSDYAVLGSYCNDSLKQNSEHISGEALGGSYANKLNTSGTSGNKKDPAHRVSGSVIPMIPPADLRLVRTMFDRLPGRGSA